jgi:hypothetical protein
VVDAGANRRICEARVPDQNLTLDNIFDEEVALSRLIEHLYSTCAQRFAELEALKAELRGAIPLPLREVS